MISNQKTHVFDTEKWENTPKDEVKNTEKQHFLFWGQKFHHQVFWDTTFDLEIAQGFQSVFVFKFRQKTKKFTPKWQKPLFEKRVSEKRFKNALGLNCNRTTIETGPDQKGQHQCVCKVSGIAIWSNEWSNEPIHKIGEIIVWPKKQRPCAPWGHYEK